MFLSWSCDRGKGKNQLEWRFQKRDMLKFWYLWSWGDFLKNKGCRVFERTQKTKLMYLNVDNKGKDPPEVQVFNRPENLPPECRVPYSWLFNTNLKNHWYSLKRPLFWWSWHGQIWQKTSSAGWYLYWQAA